MFLLLVIVNPFSFTCLTKITKHYYPFQFFVKSMVFKKSKPCAQKCIMVNPMTISLLKQPRHKKKPSHLTMKKKTFISKAHK